ncbi:hypothetical protein Efla_000393 [Eimeria flavescens]
MLEAGGPTRARLLLLKGLLLLHVLLLLLLQGPPPLRTNTAADAGGPSRWFFQGVHPFEWGPQGADAAPRSKDYYQLLGAYRKLAKKLHPDVAPGKEKEFMEIAKAHEVLSDPDQRRKYDAFGEEGVAGGAGSAGPDGFPFDVFASRA